LREKTTIPCSYRVIQSGLSRSFPHAHPFLDAAQGEGDILFLLGQVPPDVAGSGDASIVVVELNTECLAVHTDGAGKTLFGFSRWRLGDLSPTNLIELVVAEAARPEDVATARAIFEAVGFEVSLCADRAGRIVDRLIRPQFNLALDAVDNGLATAMDLDLCLKLGLGYREGLFEPVTKSGLAHHYDVTAELFAIYGQSLFAPGRSATVAKQRAAKEAAISAESEMQG
jgi:3-hydroxybutyryl-CoA dehydrogenase